MTYINSTCEHCKEEFSYAHKHGNLKKYCDSKCNSKAHYWRNREEEKHRREQHSSNFYERKILSRIKHRCKKTGVPFNLETSDIVIPSHCPVLGIKLIAHVKGKAKGYNPEAVSVDRIDPKGGYLKGNVRIISARANLLKSNATLEELEAILKDVRNLHENGLL